MKLEDRVGKPFAYVEGNGIVIGGVQFGNWGDEIRMQKKCASINAAYSQALASAVEFALEKAAREVEALIRKTHITATSKEDHEYINMLVQDSIHQDLRFTAKKIRRMAKEETGPIQ